MSARITDEIHAIYLKVIGEPAFRGKSVKVIHEEATRRILLEDHWVMEDVPSVNWAFKAVKDAKDRLTPDDKFLEQEWTLGSFTSTDYEHSPEVTKLLIELWRRANVGGKVLTNRTARWAAYLAAVFPDDMPHGRRLSDVFEWATEYSQEELAATLLGVPLSTSALDQQLSFHVGANYRQAELWKEREGWNLLKTNSPETPERLFSYSRTLLEQLDKEDLSEWADMYAILIVHETYHPIHELLNRWESQLTAFEYDLAFLGLRTIKDDPAGGWAEMDDQQRLDLTDRVAEAIQSGNHKAFKEATTGISK